MAKSFVMYSKSAGFDMTTQDGINAAMAHYNSRLPGPGSLPPLPPLPHFAVHEIDSPKHSSKGDRKKKKAQRQAKKRNRR